MTNNIEKWQQEVTRRTEAGQNCGTHRPDRSDGIIEDGKRHLRNVWHIATRPFREAHFATFPPELVEPCVKAGTSEAGVCDSCGAPWKRVTEKRLVPGPKACREGVRDDRDETADKQDQGSNRQKDGHIPGWRRSDITTGWSPSCECHGHFEKVDGPEDLVTGSPRKVRVYVPDGEVPPPTPATVFDPFGGAGTVGLVADRLRRNAVLVELNPEYAEIARKRISGEAGLFDPVQVISAKEAAE